jgi:ADP-ribose pyrophosphatase YjhB (NUDIX family)
MEQFDCCFTQDKHWFRYRAGAIIRKDDSILMATNPGVDYLYSVGGAVQLGETAEEAVVREVLEETGVRMEVERLAAIHENLFFSDMGIYPDGMACHELALYFIMKPKDLEQIKAKGISLNQQPERLVWVPMADFHQSKTYPDFLPRVFESSHVLHVVTRELQQAN